MPKRVTYADLARHADSGRRIVLSVGSIDGVLLAALRKVQTAAAAEPSTWGPGVNEGGDDDATDKVTRRTRRY